jgi:glycosyltransferase involved in cell wall biosynthesis
MRFGLFGGERDRSREKQSRAPDNKSFREAGDRARDLRDWTEAERCYAQHLEHAQDDFAIWVQLGNSRKELGDYPGALTAYEKAIKLDGDDPDAHLQRGHALKLAGRVSDAIAAYRRSVECRSESNPALLELVALAPEEIAGLPNLGAVIEPGVRAVYFDVTDLVDYLKANPALSGIQRVAANLIAQSGAYSRTAGDCTITFIVPDYLCGKLFAVAGGLVGLLVETVAAGYCDRAILDKLLVAIETSKKPVQPIVGDVLIIPGAFWIYRNSRHYDILNGLKRHGVHIVVFVHDLISVRNPAYVEAEAAEVFRMGFNDIAVIADRILTSSTFVAKDIGLYLEERFNFKVEVESLPLATELGLSRVSPTDARDELSYLASDGYVLCVGTIEIRKNHVYLIRIWERLIREFKGRIPNLVFVGKWGWRIDDLREEIEESDYLESRLHIYNDASDAELAWFYEHCLFTIYPSFAEGWGLPVGESLAFGKPCIASNTTSLPEVGGDLCKYVDPCDLADGYRVVSAVLSDQTALSDWTAGVRREFKPKSWRSFSEEFFSAAVGGAKNSRPENRESHCILETGTIAPFGAAALAELDARGAKLISARMSRISGWHALESWGCWASGRRATLRFRTRLPPGTDCTAYLHLRTMDEDNLADCTIKSGDLATLLRNMGSTPGWRTARCQIGDEGFVDLALLSGKGFRGRSDGEKRRGADERKREEEGRADEREVYVGLIAIAIAPTGDKAARQRIISQIVPED